MYFIDKITYIFTNKSDIQRVWRDFLSEHDLLQGGNLL